jgi:hypothetical protein
MASPLAPILGAVATAVLQRTYLVQNNTPTGIPQILAVLDVVQEEDPEFSAEVTQHPVEQGSEVSDHIQIKNPTLHLKGTISNSPLDLSTSIANVLAGGIDLITSSQARSNILNSGVQQAAGFAGAALMGGASTLQGAVGGAADAIARAILLSVFDARTPFDVVTKRFKYESMVIEKISFPRDSDTGYQLVFEMDLIKLRIVSPFDVQINTVDEGVVTSALNKSNLGGQASKQVSDQAASSVNKSWMRAIIKGVTG